MAGGSKAELVSWCRDAACDPPNRVAGRREAGAAATGELLSSPEGPARTPMSAEVSKFIRQILTDGTYEQEIIRIGKEDPDLASM
jgi:hypothetical protein